MISLTGASELMVTSFYSPELERYYVAVPERGNQQAQIRVFQPE